eukprot:410584-Pyramimonas_sp.AAC.1
MRRSHSVMVVVTPVTFGNGGCHACHIRSRWLSRRSHSVTVVVTPVTFSNGGCHAGHIRYRM